MPRSTPDRAALPNRYGTIRRRGIQTLGAWNRIAQGHEIGTVAKEMGTWRRFYWLLYDLLKGDETRRKWLVRNYGLSIPEVVATLKAAALRVEAAKGKNLDRRAAVTEAQRKINDYIVLDSGGLRGITGIFETAGMEYHGIPQKPPPANKSSGQKP